MRKIGYNSQINNKSFRGVFPGSKQCATTSAWMFMSYYTNLIKAEDDDGLAEYLDDVEVRVGYRGIAEQIIARMPWISGFSSMWYKVQEAGITKWLNSRGVFGYAKFSESLTTKDLPQLVEAGPVIIGTNKLGGLPGGHIILIVDQNNGDYIVNDPFGNAITKYKNKDGHEVRYPKGWLHNYVNYSGKIRVIYWQV
jgi:hypothetical protein